MIEIKADYYDEGVNVGEHFYINEKRISAIRAPRLEKESLKASFGWADAWTFEVVIDGCHAKFRYHSKKSCEEYYKMVFDAINLDD